MSDATNNQGHAVGSLVDRVVEAWRARRRRRYWTPERQLEHLLLMVQADNRWLAHDKTADALTTRYLAALAPDWMSRYHANPDAFRRLIVSAEVKEQRGRFAGYFIELPSGMSYRLWEQGGHEQQPGEVALYESA